MEIGSNVTLPCYVQGYPEPKIKWRRLDNMPIFSRPFSVSSISQLRTGALFISSRLKEIHFIQIYTNELYIFYIWVLSWLKKWINLANTFCVCWISFQYNVKLIYGNCHKWITFYSILWHYYVRKACDKQCDFFISHCFLLQIETLGPLCG